MKQIEIFLGEIRRVTYANLVKAHSQLIFLFLKHLKKRSFYVILNLPR